jgi:hypothetical protein
MTSHGSETGEAHDATVVNCLGSLLDRLSESCETLPDKRHGANATLSIADIGMVAFSAFFGAPTARARGHGRSNCKSRFGLSLIPSDNHIRAMLDRAEPALLDPAYDAAMSELERSE